ncbi:uncharacterized protein LOC126702405 isoform X5 [Quercus robur]|uniref:uncharacterized protein LOC126702405 isoform X5 n=1 Tax=Quercus robur TaxID=38942 RepID=UPI002163ADC8|nr:uncharacterized protein LOC126702405 isoform X5 [Quercus robur]
MGLGLCGKINSETKKISKLPVMEDSSERKREMETKLIEKFSEVIPAIKSAKHVDEVVCALHSLALLLFPLDSSLLSGSVDQRYREQVLSAKLPSEEKRREWWQAFYQGAAFPTLAQFLLLGSVDQRYREQVLSAKVPSEEKRREWWQVFYQGAAFPTLAWFLLLDCCCMQILLPIGYLVSPFQHVYMSMMFSLLMDRPLRLFRPCFLVYSRMQLMTMMLILSIPILKGFQACSEISVIKF